MNVFLLNRMILCIFFILQVQQVSILILFQNITFIKFDYFQAQPKGIERPVGGHIATLRWTMSTTYGMKKDDVWWAASDLGWVVGHSYICYGPLLYGITSVMYEGKPDRTPDPGSYFR